MIDLEPIKASLKTKAGPDEGWNDGLVAELVEELEALRPAWEFLQHLASPAALGMSHDEVYERVLLVVGATEKRLHPPPALGAEDKTPTL